MTLGVELIVILAIFLGLLCVGMTIPFAILVPSVLYLLTHAGLAGLKGLGLVSWGSMNSFTLSAIPLFILMAEILQESKLSLRVYKGLSTLVAWMPGGLLQTNIAGCAIFAAISGSSVVTAASIGRVALPELQRRNYSPRLSAGSLAAGGTLGILIPPSIAMIVYGTFTETSVAKLFMAGVVPGLLLTAMFMAYIAVHALVQPSVSPIVNRKHSASEILVAFLDIIPFVVLIGGTIGSIYSGLVTPTEAAAVGCVLAMIIARFWGEFNFGVLKRALQTTVRVCGNILFIVYAAYAFSYAISYAGVGEQITQFLVGMKLSRLEFFAALFVLHRARVSGRKPRYDRRDRAAALSRAVAIWRRSDLVRRHPRPLHRDGTDIAADRNQSVRDPEHLDWKAQRRRHGHDPVSFNHVRAARAAGAFP